MSTGMKQKISLVISIVHNPDIIIFDEPTNGLDVITERIVVNFLKELREQGKCIIISSHIFSLIEKFVTVWSLLSVANPCAVIRWKMLWRDSR